MSSLVLTELHGAGVATVVRVLKGMACATKGDPHHAREESTVDIHEVSSWLILLCLDLSSALRNES